MKQNPESNFICAEDYEFNAQKDKQIKVSNWTLQKPQLKQSNKERPTQTKAMQKWT